MSDPARFHVVDLNIDMTTALHSFMKNVYTAFSTDQNAVGFATLR